MHVWSRKWTVLRALNGKLEALGHFLSKSAERSLSFFKTLKDCIQKKDFRWSTKAETSFQELKSYLKSLPALTSPKLEETLTFYLATTNEALSAVLLTKRRGVEKPIYFISHALQGPELNYPSLEKVALALVHAARRLRHYFQAHKICVLTDQPIRQVQILAGFLAESPRTKEKIETKYGGKDLGQLASTASPGWILFTDGASSTKGSGLA
ncbi:reverse transcriptase domain-containing protein [Tanacetum coccineum]|uniref:Reverse transcriptase domain-containing protein n=1 Tax=Tanacetum coccineum TaxID=301880 RepID=A0ABQ5IU58_9ASTR